MQQCFLFLILKKRDKGLTAMMPSPSRSPWVASMFTCTICPVRSRGNHLHTRVLLHPAAPEKVLALAIASDLENADARHIGFLQGAAHFLHGHRRCCAVYGYGLDTFDQGLTAFAQHAGAGIGGGKIEVDLDYRRDGELSEAIDDGAPSLGLSSLP